MNNLRITREFSFEMAHFLPGYNGPCRSVHGHSFRLFVTVSGVPSTEEGDSSFGMVMDFQQLKKLVNKEIIDKYDHALMVKKGCLDKKAMKYDGFDNVIEVPYQPTSEKMIVAFAEILKQKLPDNVSLFSLKLYETAASAVEWYRDDQ
ncbi:MAG: 6-pyruvoyl trahydropterin synthase family protein [Bacteroidota bacterium]